MNSEERVTSTTDDQVAKAEEALKELRTAYEKYFAGIERVAPEKDRSNLKNVIRRMMTQRNANTARKFRIQSLQASLITHESYWDRICRQIEEGTYRRDLYRMKRRETDPLPPTPTAPPTVQPSPLSEATAPKSPVTKSTAEPTLAPSSHPIAPPTAAPKVIPESLQRLHQALLKARAELGDSRPLDIDVLAETVRKQVALIKEQYKCERVEFKVVVKDGKAILKAIPR